MRCEWEDLGTFGFDLKFQHFSRDKKGRKKVYKPKFFKKSCELLLEGLECNRFDINALDDATTKSIYQSYLELMPPPPIEIKYPERDWPKTWLRLNNGVLTPSSRDILYLIVHERVFTRERGHRFIPNLIDSPFCTRCPQNEV